MDGKPAKRLSIGKAVETGLVANETLGYFLARINQFLTKVNILIESNSFRPITFQNFALQFK